MKRITEYKLFILGAFPPPLHGLSAVTQAVYDRLESTGVPLCKLNTSPPTLKRGLYRFQRLPRLFSAWGRLARTGGRKQILYIPLSGGWGQFYDIGTLLLARILGMVVFLHHHSFSYLSSKRSITKILFTVAGQNAVHIVLCEKMQNALWEKYKCSKIIQLSNLALFPEKDNPRTKKQLQTVGFLSNLTAEKGGWEVIELAKSIQEKRLPLHVIVAGPCLEPDLKIALQHADQEGVLQWRGAVYGEEKKRFWNDTSVFIFPTQYHNEAEPLVVWEALAASVPVLAYDRGCISGQIGTAGKSIHRDKGFVVNALPVLESWLSNPKEYKKNVTASEERSYSMRREAEIQWKTFVKTLQKRT